MLKACERCGEEFRSNNIKRHMLVHRLEDANDAKQAAKIKKARDIHGEDFDVRCPKCHVWMSHKNVARHLDTCKAVPDPEGIVERLRLKRGRPKGAKKRTRIDWSAKNKKRKHQCRLPPGLQYRRREDEHDENIEAEVD